MDRASERTSSVLVPLLALASALWGVGCRTPTSLTLEITTTIPCAELKGLSIAVGSAATLESSPATTTTTRCTPIDAKRNRIGSLVVVPSGDSSAEVALRVVAGLDRPVAECSAATGWAGCVVARRILAYETHVELVVPVELHRGCKGVACDASTTCVFAGNCASSRLTDPGSCNGEGCLTPLSPDAGVDAAPDPRDGDPDGASDAAPDAAKACAATEKSCDGRCVSLDAPAYGCGPLTCSPCGDPSAHATYACAAGACTKTGCATGYKDCGGVCVATDAEHGCGATSCAACPAVNGVASCAAGACKLTCNTGYKLCGGKCVNVGDPTYGCGATTCDASSCPSPGFGGTLVCSGSACVLGACGPGTKACSSRCVPTDVANGCGDVTRCTPCGAGESCVGGPPTTCQCVPEPTATTCSKVECGVTKNNCGQSVNCGTSACKLPETCGGGGLANQCGCTASQTCDGVRCGSLFDACLKPYSCGCSKPNSCGGGGVAGKCGCSPLNPCDGVNCGTLPDGCGGTVTCSCTAPNVCGGGGFAGKCGCISDPVAVVCGGVGRVCGTMLDNCGRTISCGSCSSTQQCCVEYCGPKSSPCVAL